MFCEALPETVGQQRGNGQESGRGRRGRRGRPLHTLHVFMKKVGKKLWLSEGGKYLFISIVLNAISFNVLLLPDRVRGMVNLLTDSK